MLPQISHRNDAKALEGGCGCSEESQEASEAYANCILYDLLGNYIIIIICPYTFALDSNELI